MRILLMETPRLTQRGYIAQNLISVNYTAELEGHRCFKNLSGSIELLMVSRIWIWLKRILKCQIEEQGNMKMCLEYDINFGSLLNRENVCLRIKIPGYLLFIEQYHSH